MEQAAMRGSVRPVAVFSYHKLGITSLMWHPSDSAMFLASCRSGLSFFFQGCGRVSYVLCLIFLPVRPACVRVLSSLSREMHVHAREYAHVYAPAEMNSSRV